MRTALERPAPWPDQGLPWCGRAGSDVRNKTGTRTEGLRVPVESRIGALGPLASCLGQG